MKKKISQNKLIKYLAIACMIAVALMVISLSFTDDGDKVVFTPPPFEEKAVIGKPNVAKELGYSLFSRDDIPYSFLICGRVTADKTSGIVYFTNPNENNCWLRLRVLDEEGSMLGQTGILRPGEYVERVPLFHSIDNGTEITLKIMGYEPDTYYSLGSIQINTTVFE